MPREIGLAWHSGRPQLDIDPKIVLRFRAQGLSWRQISSRLGVGTTTVRRIAQRRAKTVPKVLPRIAARPKSATSQVEAEAKFFIQLVRDGWLTPEEAEADIAVSPADREFLEQYAAWAGPVTAKMIHQVLALRDGTLAEFRRACGKAA